MEFLRTEGVYRTSTGRVIPFAEEGFGQLGLPISVSSGPVPDSTIAPAAHPAS